MAKDIALYRDTRSSTIAPASVRRELALLSSVFEQARLEWDWCDANPCRDIRKPANSKHRDRTLQWWEIKRLTWNGCNFADEIRNETLQNKAKEHVLKPNTSFSFSILKEWLKAEISQGLPTRRGSN